jgi:protein PhnA
MGALIVCPECAHEWDGSVSDTETADVIKDANGNVLNDGDSVIVVKDLPVKGQPKPIKSGTKVNKIRLVHDNGDHNIDAKVDGFGSMMLKSSVVKKA